jgi:hypothetical protein
VITLAEEEKMAYAALERLRGKDTNIVAEVFQIQEHRNQNLVHQLSFLQVSTPDPILGSEHPSLHIRRPFSSHRYLS